MNDRCKGFVSFTLCFSLIFSYSLFLSCYILSTIFLISLFYFYFPVSVDDKTLDVMNEKMRKEKRNTNKCKLLARTEVFKSHPL